MHNNKNVTFSIMTFSIRKLSIKIRYDIQHNGTQGNKNTCNTQHCDTLRYSALKMQHSV
jgi:hypothetical protein